SSLVPIVLISLCWTNSGRAQNQLQIAPKKAVHMPADAIPEAERSTPLSPEDLQKQADKAQKEKLELEALTEKAKAGDAEAQYKLGVHYCFEQSTEAINWFKLAATQGVVAAQYDLGMLNMIFRGGNDASQSYKSAYYWYALALKSNKNDDLVPLGNDHLKIAL